MEDAAASHFPPPCFPQYGQPRPNALIVQPSTWHVPKAPCFLQTPRALATNLPSCTPSSCNRHACAGSFCNRLGSRHASSAATADVYSEEPMMVDAVVGTFNVLKGRSKREKKPVCTLVRLGRRRSTSHRWWAQNKKEAGMPQNFDYSIQTQIKRHRFLLFFPSPLPCRCSSVGKTAACTPRYPLWDGFVALKVALTTLVSPPGPYGALWVAVAECAAICCVASNLRSEAGPMGVCSVWYRYSALRWKRCRGG